MKKVEAHWTDRLSPRTVMLGTLALVALLLVLFFVLPLNAQAPPQKPPDKPVVAEVTKAAEIPFTAEMISTLDTLPLRLQLNDEQIRSRQAELVILKQEQTKLQDELKALPGKWKKDGYDLDIANRKWVLTPPKPKGPGQ